MSDTEISPHLNAALIANPKLATEIGMLIGDYAALELLYFQLYHLLSSPNTPEDSLKAFFSQRSINRKAELVTRLLPVLSENLRVGAKRITRRMKMASKRRTDIAHSCFFGSETETHMFRMIDDAQRVRPLDTEFIKQTTDLYRILAEDILSFSAVLLSITETRLLDRTRQLMREIYGLLPRGLLRTHLQMPNSGEPRVASYKRLGLDENTGKIAIAILSEHYRLNVKMNF